MYVVFVHVDLFFSYISDLSDNSGNPVNGVLDTNSLFLPGSGFAKQIYSKRLVYYFKWYLMC